MSYLIIIPARLKSTRLKEKMLIKINKIPIIVRTYHQCLKATSRKKIIIATDSEKILKSLKKEDAKCVLIKSKCLTGTDRIAEVAKKYKARFYINVQGDEPFLNPIDLKKIIKSLKYLKKYDVINGYSMITNKEEYKNTSIPKLVFNKNKELLYMSRAPIPSSKKFHFNSAYKQICIYAFKRKALIDFKSQKKTEIEKKEDIEILRFLERGYKIKMIKMSGKSFAIDTPKDLKKAKNFIIKNELN